jgi:hypothetical protein
MSVQSPTAFTTSNPTPTTIDLSWTNGDSYDSVNGIRVRYGATYKYFSGSATSGTITGLTEGTLYWFYISGKKTVGNTTTWSDEEPAPAAVYTTLLAPASLAAAQIAGGACALSWTVRSGNGVYQQIQKSTDGVNFSDTMGPILAEYTNFNVTSLTGIHWYFRVRCYNSNTTSAYSNIADAWTALGAPTNLQASGASSTSILLTWTDNSTGETMFRIERGESSYESAFSQIGTVGAGVTTYTDTGGTPGLTTGKKYYYRVRAYNPDQLSSAWSNIANATPVSVALPTNVEAHCDSSTQVTLIWKDNSNNETGFKIYQDGALVYTTAANVTSHTFTGLTKARWYSYRVEAYNATDSSGLTPVVRVYTSDPPKAPSALKTVVLSTSSIRLNWSDNSSNETGFKIEQSDDGTTFTQVATVAQNIETYVVTGLSSNTQYWFQVRAYNYSGNSAYTTAATGVTFAAIAIPTNVEATPMFIGGVLCVEVRFDDNSTEETSHEIERADDGGSYAALVSTLPNQYVYYDTAVVAGHYYSYKIRAVQDTSVTNYSTAATASLVTAPSAPTALAMGTLSFPDKISLSWTPTTGEVSYEVAQSTNGSTFTIIITLPAGADRYTVTGLTPNTTYYFKVRARGTNGYSGYSSTVSGTTPAAYVMTALELLCLSSKKRLINLVEVNPAIVLSGWELTSGKTYTYEAPMPWTEADIDTVAENGKLLKERASVASVEASGGWYYDGAAEKIYVRSSGGDDPTNYAIVASAWVYFTSWQRGATVYNGHRYLPLIPADGLPEITQTLEAYYKGAFVATQGSISFINGKAKAWGGGHYFDDRCAAWEWMNRKVTILCGGEAFDYSDFQPLATGLIQSTTISNSRFTVSLKDARAGLHRSLPLRTYTADDFPNLYAGVTNGSSSGDVPRPYYYGSVTHVVPICIDTVNFIFELMDGRLTSVEEVKKGDTVLTAGTDYWVDYSLGRIQLAESVGYTPDDTLLVSSTGAADATGTAIETGPMIYLDILRNDMLLEWGDINLDSIWEANAVCTAKLGVKIYKTTTTEEIIGLLEKSCLAYSFQDASGRIGFKITPTTAPSNVIYLPEERIVDITRDESADQVYASVKINYDEWPSTGRFLWIETLANVEKWTSGVLRTLEITTALTSAADAKALGDDILAVLNFPTINITTPRVLFPYSVGDMIALTRKRYFDPQGTANNRLFQIMQIGKSAGTGRVQLRIQPVA